MNIKKITSFASLFLLTTGCHSTLPPFVTKTAILRQGAGFVFVCREEPSILLAKRAKHVNEPGTWASLGGSVEPGETYEETARREVHEEAGSMPKINRILARLRYENKGFVFMTFIADLSKEEKRRWRFKRNHEHDEIKWFTELPGNLHPGLSATLKQFMEGYNEI